MAPLVAVPADFGIRHIGQPCQGDFSFLMSDGGDPIWAHSVVLSLYSPFFRDLRQVSRLKSVDASHFSRQAVDCLIESCYSGETITLSTKVLDDVLRMSSMFKIPWLSKKCENIILHELSKFNARSEFGDFKFLVDQAINQITFKNNHDHLNQLARILKSDTFQSGKTKSLIKEYAKNMHQLRDEEIKACLVIAGPNMPVLIECLISHLNKQHSRPLDRASKIFLGHLGFKFLHTNFAASHDSLVQSLCNNVTDSKIDSRVLINTFKETVTCPFNFRKNHSRSDSTGSFEFKLDNSDVVIKANSWILALNSPVIHSVVKLGRYTLTSGVSEAGAEAVHVFIESCYKGSLETEELPRDSFRFIYKMSHSLGVIWLANECEKLFLRFVQMLDYDNYIGMKFVVEEAHYQTVTYQRKYFQNLIVNRFNSRDLSAARETFIQRYLGDFSDFTREKFELCQAIVRSDYRILIEALIACLEEHHDLAVETLKKCDELIKKIPDDYLERNFELCRRLLRAICSAKVTIESDDILFMISIIGHMIPMKLPLDYGRLHIDNADPALACLSFTAVTGDPIVINPILLCINSPVIKHLVTELHQSSLEADDFTRQTVECFTEACHTGRLDTVDITICGELYKMGHVFKVDWIKRECEKFFEEHVKLVINENCVYDQFSIAADQALHQQDKVKEDSFLKIITKVASSNIIPLRRKKLILEYLGDFVTQSTARIDFCIALIGSDVHILLESLIKHLEDPEVNGLNDNSRYLLKTLDLSLCFTKKPGLREVLFAALHKLTDVEREDFRLILDICKKLSQSPVD